MDLTEGLLSSVKSHFETNVKLRQLFPDLVKQDTSRLGTKKKFVIPGRTDNTLRDPTVWISTGQATRSGSHPDLIVGDDLVNDRNYKSAIQLEKVRQSFIDSRPLLNPGGYVILAATRYTFDDLSGWVLTEIERDPATWAVSKKACWYRDAAGNLVPMLPQYRTRKGELRGYTIESLKTLEAEDPVKFANQYLNEPLVEAEQWFSEALVDRQTIHEIPPQVELSPPVLIFDLAESKSAGADESVGGVGRLDPRTGNLYIVDLVSGRWHAAELAAEILRMTLKHRPRLVLIEQSNGSTYLLELVKMLANQKGIRVPIDFHPVSNAKDAKRARISFLQAGMTLGKLWLAYQVAFQARDQFVKYPATQHDDLVDTIGMLYEHHAITKHQVALPKPRQNPFPKFLSAVAEFQKPKAPISPFGSLGHGYR